MFTEKSAVHIVWVFTKKGTCKTVSGWSKVGNVII